MFIVAGVQVWVYIPCCLISVEGIKRRHYCLLMTEQPYLVRFSQHSPGEGKGVERLEKTVIFSLALGGG